MPSPATTDYASAARRFGVCARTARRWHAAGVDLDNPASVAAHLLSLKRPSFSALKAIAHLLP